MKVEMTDEPLTSENLSVVIDDLNRYQDFVLTGDVSINTFGFLLVDHLDKQAVLWLNGEEEVISYEGLDVSIIYSNHYMAYISGKPIVVLNCDPLLGDAFERGIVLAYQYRFGTVTTLNPSEIRYFQSPKENIPVRYLRFQMIETLKDVSLDSADMEAFAHYYWKWQEQMGENTHQVAEYDYYDGLLAYLTLKVRQMKDLEYDVESYIEGLQNDYGVYSKTSEYKVLGLLWFLVAENTGMPLYEDDDVKSDRYKLLIHSVPYSTVEVNDNYSEFQEAYGRYLADLEGLSEEMVMVQAKLEPISLELVSESYDETIQIGVDLYVYTNYRGRLADMSVIDAQTMLARVSPYNIEYFHDGRYE